MPNAFLIVRFVFLSILLYLSLFVLCFAAWNAYAMGAAGLSIPNTLYLMFICTSLTITLGTLSFIEMYCGVALFSRVRFESAWTGALTLLQLATVILYAFVNSTSKCNGDWNVCSSSSVLLPFACISFVTTLAYFTTLTATATAHANESPEVWSMSVYQVEWFATTMGLGNRMRSFSTMNPSKVKMTYTHQHSASTPLTIREKDCWSMYLENIGKTPAPAWGKPRKPVSVWSKQPLSDVEKAPKRAVDPAFPCRNTESKRSISLENLRAPPTPARLREVASEGSISRRFIERIRESRYILRTQARLSSDSSDSLTPFATSSVSSGSVTDVDEYPIPCPRLSSWVTADTHRDLSDDGF